MFIGFPYLCIIKESPIICPEFKLYTVLNPYFSVKLIPRKSAIIFDEVQSFPQARAAIKYLVADGRYDYIETFFWLSGSMISNECFLCSDPNVGLSMYEDRSYVKCYMGDTGLLLSHAFDENELLESEIRKTIFHKLFNTL